MADHMEVSLDVPATPEKVWNVISDLKRLPDWLPMQVNIEYPGATMAGVGVGVKIERDSPMGRVHVEQVFDRVDAPKLLGWMHRNETLSGKPITQIKDFTTALTLTPTSAGQTRLTVRSEWKPVGMMGSIANSIMKPRLKQEYEAALKNIARLATA